jgi:hypothetical protein
MRWLKLEINQMKNKIGFWCRYWLNAIAWGLWLDLPLKPKCKMKFHKFLEWITKEREKRGEV